MALPGAGLSQEQLEAGSPVASSPVASIDSYFTFLINVQWERIEVAEISGDRSHHTVHGTFRRMARFGRGLNHPCGFPVFSSDADLRLFYSLLFPQNPSWLAHGSHSVNLCWINEQPLISHLQRGRKQRNSVAGELPSDTGVGWIWMLLHLLHHHFEKWIFLPWYRLKKSFHCRIWFSLLTVIVFLFLQIFTWFEIQNVGKGVQWKRFSAFSLPSLKTISVSTF